MTKRDIKVIVQQCNKGLDYDSAMRSIVKLSIPTLEAKDVLSIVENIKLFQSLYNINKRNNKNGH
jgi:hypothetical protein